MTTANDSSEQCDDVEQRLRDDVLEKADVARDVWVRWAIAHSKFATGDGVNRTEHSRVIKLAQDTEPPRQEFRAALAAYATYITAKAKVEALRELPCLHPKPECMWWWAPACDMSIYKKQAVAAAEAELRDATGVRDA